MCDARQQSRPCADEETPASEIQHSVTSQEMHSVHDSASLDTGKRKRRLAATIALDRFAHLVMTLLNCFLHGLNLMVPKPGKVYLIDFANLFVIPIQ